MNCLKIFTSIILLTCATIAQASVTKETNRITVQVGNPTADGARIVSLQVISDNIIRVQATSEECLPNKQKSLMIVGQKGSPQFSTSEEVAWTRIMLSLIT